jgi:PAS domain S-box-containing protein
MERDLLEHIFNVSRRMAETRDLNLLLNDVMDEAIRLVGAERGYVVLTQSDGSLGCRVQRGKSGRVLADGDEFSRSILRQVVEAGQPLVLRDARQDPRFGEAESVVILGLRSVMCVPLISRGDTIGAIYVENRSIQGRFSDDDVPPLVIFANQAAVAVENARLFQTLQKAHDELEIRVEERTAELARANEELRNEIAERKRAEEALRDSEQKLRNLVEQSHDGIALTDEQGSIIEWNQGMEEIFGLRRREVLGQPTWDVRFQVESDERKTPAVYERLKSSTLEFLRTGQTPSASQLLEEDIQRPDGTRRTNQTSMFPVKTEKGFLVGSITRDITEQRLLEARLRQARRLEAVGTLAGGVAHHLNNIMTGILGNVSLAKREVEPGSQARQDLESAERSVRQAADLVKQLLAFSRKLQVERVGPVNLNLVVEEVADLLRQAIDRQRIEIVVRITADLWPVTADYAQMGQVLMNLCFNARDALLDSPGGRSESAGRLDNGATIIIETKNVTLNEEFCRSHPEAHPGPYVCLAVSDNGCGMDAETQARAFEPFFTTKEIGKSAGLGLALVHGTVEGCGGFITLRSKPGVGTAVNIYLPRAEGPTPAGESGVSQTGTPML